MILLMIVLISIMDKVLDAASSSVVFLYKGDE